MFRENCQKVINIFFAGVVIFDTCKKIRQLALHSPTFTQATEKKTKYGGGPKESVLTIDQTALYRHLQHSSSAICPVLSDYFEY